MLRRRRVLGDFAAHRPSLGRAAAFPWCRCRRDGLRRDDVGIGDHDRSALGLDRAARRRPLDELAEGVGRTRLGALGQREAHDDPRTERCLPEEADGRRTDHRPVLDHDRESKLTRSSGGSP
ncbi:hypothetical protein PLANTIT3_60244 [Plantibacter sp. T3]|nr:hypothetical protein PLANTIT3_60244 [Plantibacter sp. T3]